MVDDSTRCECGHLKVHHRPMGCIAATENPKNPFEMVPCKCTTHKEKRK